MNESSRKGASVGKSFKICEEIVGLLVLRRCSKPAVAECSQCGKKLCKDHIVRDQQGRVLCLECARNIDGLQEHPMVHISYLRYTYYDDPYWYMYNDRDFDTFDRREYIEDNNDIDVNDTFLES